MNKKLLLVEDDIDISESLSEILASMHFDVRIAQNGLEGFEILKGEDFDIVLSDIHMPKMDGFDFIKNSLVLKPNLKFLFMTGFASYTTEQLNSLNPRAILRKPFSTADLQKALADQQGIH